MKAIVLLFLCAAFHFPVHADTNQVHDFAVRYAQLELQVPKRTLCIEVIDAGILYLGSPIDEVRKIFQKDFRDIGTDDAGNKRAIVLFNQPKRSLNPIASEIWTGWYLTLTYRVDGSVMHYSLSNESKEESMRLKYERQIREGKTNSEPGLPPVN